MTRSPVGVDPSQVGVLVCPCGTATVKLPGLYEPLCLRCWTAERDAHERRMVAENGGWVSANVAGDTCLVCKGTDVDADGCLWWCNRCVYATRVAYPPT